MGPSLSFLRKQRGIRALLSRGSTADTLYDDLVPTLDDAELGIAGFHIFTFNQLLESWRWQQARADPRSHRTREPGPSPTPRRVRKGAGIGRRSSPKAERPS